MELSKAEQKVLRYVHKLGKFDMSELEDLGLDDTDLKDAVHSLLENDLLLAQRVVLPGMSTPVYPGPYRIGPAGKRHVEGAWVTLVQQWLPLIISAIALLKSFSAELTWLWQQLTQLLR